MKPIFYRAFIFAALLAVVAAATGNAAASSASVSYISSAELKDWLGQPAVVVLDVRVPKHVAASRFKVKDAVWVNPEAMDGWVDKFSKDDTYVLY